MDLKSILIDNMDLSVRAHNCLTKAGIKNVRQVVGKTPRELIRLPNMGRTTVRDVERALGKLGLCLGMRPSDIAALERSTDKLKPTSPHADNRASKKKTRFEDLIALDVAALELTVRAQNCLANANITKVGDLIVRTSTDLWRLPNMGRMTLQHIERTLGELGLRLGTGPAEIVAMLRRGQDLSVEEIDAFVRAVDVIKRCGIDSVEDLVGRKREELLAMSGMDGRSLDLIEDRLRSWGVELCVPGSCPSLDSGMGVQELADTGLDEREDSAETIKDGLIHVVTRLLSDAKPPWPLCFLAYHGIARGPCLTLQQLADNGAEYGFGRAVTRERIRQVLERAERRLRKSAGRIQFRRWETAMAKARGYLPTSIRSFMSHFGYESVTDAEGTYNGLARCAEVFGLEFPVEKKDLAGIGVLVVDGGDSGAYRKIARLKDVAGGPYVKVTEVARKLDCDTDLLRRVIDTSARWEFLDGTREYFWKRPKLPPKNYCITGNAILSSLCKVFSVTYRAETSDLVQSVARDRMVRKSGQIQDIPVQVLEGIAERSGLFELRDGQIVRNAALRWCSVGERDVALLKVCVEHGRTVGSRVLYSALVHGGMTVENASVTVAYSPFLVHTRSGLRYKEGVYKFVPRPEEIDLDALAGHVAEDGGTSDTGDSTGISEQVLRIPISSRTRLSGRYFDSEPIGLDGTWEVHDGEGCNIGSISISDRIVDGLIPVIEVFGLKNDEVLELRSVDSPQVLVAVR